MPITRLDLDTACNLLCEKALCECSRTGSKPAARPDFRASTAGYHSLHFGAVGFPGKVVYIEKQSPYWVRGDISARIESRG